MRDSCGQGVRLVAMTVAWAAACGPDKPPLGMTGTTGTRPALADAGAPAGDGATVTRPPPMIVQATDGGVERLPATTAGTAGTVGCAAGAATGGRAGDGGTAAGGGAGAVIPSGGSGGSAGAAPVGTGGAPVPGSGGTNAGTGGSGPAGSGGGPGSGGRASSGGAGSGGASSSGGGPARSGGASGTGGGAGSGGAGSGGASGGGTGSGGASNGGAGSGGAPAGASPPGVGELAIVELLINPASTDTGREWIELMNRTTHTITLAGLHIADAANDAAVEFEATAALVPPGGRAVLVQSADATKNGGISAAAAPVGSFGTLVSLNNEADSISICAGACSGAGIVIDKVTWDATLGTGYDGHALVIDDAGKRCPATVAFGDGGSYGTPGAAGSACP